MISGIIGGGKGIQGTTAVGSFGDLVTSPLVPIVAIKAVYGLLDEVETFTSTGGGVTAADNQFVMSSGTSVGGYGTAWAREPVVYSPGLGCEARLTAQFTTGIASSTQLAGLFSAADGMFFGYNGAAFGIMHRSHGEFEVRTLTVTGAASGAETVTVTLNGTAYNASVTGGTDVQTDCHEIEQQLNAGAAATSWHIQHIDDAVIFVFKGVGAKSDTYSVSSTGALTGSIAQTNAGAAATETWTSQANWNKDQADWLDVTKGNLYRVSFAFLGYGPLNYYIMHPIKMEWVLVHQIQFPNQNTIPNFGNPSMRVGWASASLGSSGTNLVVKGASGMAALQGTRPIGRHFGMSGVNTSVSTEAQILTCQIRREFGGKSCNAKAKPQIFCATDSTKGMVFRVYLNPTVSGTTLHQYVDENNSICLYDTAGTTVSGGRLLGAFVAGPSGNISIDEHILGIELIAGDELVVTGQVTTGAASGGYVTINVEEFI